MALYFQCRSNKNELLQTLIFSISAPTAPPQNVRGIAKHSQTLIIFWDSPPEEHQNSPITKYKLYYTLRDREPTTIELGKDWS